MSFRNVPSLGNDSGLLWSITKGLSGSTIASLSIVDCNLHNNDVGAVLSVLRSHQLRRDEELWTRNLRGNTGRTAKERRAVANSGLIALDLSGNDISDNGALQLWRHLRNDRWLVALSIRCNRIGDALKHLFSTCFIRDARERLEANQGIKVEESSKAKKSKKQGIQKKGAQNQQVLGEPLNLCGLLVDQREDFDMPCANNKVDEYHTTVAHYRSWKDRLSFIESSNLPQVARRRYSIGIDGLDGFDPTLNEEEDEDEASEEEGLGGLIGLLSPVDVLCEDPMIAGALKQYGITFEGEPPKPPVPRGDVEHPNGEGIEVHERRSSINSNIGLGLVKDEVKTLCEDFGRLFAACNTKCGVPSVMISKSDFGEVLRNVRKELNKQQAFNGAASMLRIFRIKIMEETLSRQFRAAGLYPNSFHPKSENHNTMVYLKQQIDLNRKLMVAMKREQAEKDKKHHRQHNASKEAGEEAKILLHEDSLCLDIEVEIQEHLDAKHEAGWINLWLSFMATTSAFGGVVSLEGSTELQLTAAGVMKELKRIAQSMHSKEFDETEETTLKIQKFLGFNMNRSHSADHAVLSSAELARGMSKAIGFFKLMRMNPDHSAILYLISEAIETKFSDRAEDTSVRYLHASERLFDEWFSGYAHARRKQREAKKADLLERKAAIEEQIEISKKGSLLSRFRDAGRKVDMINAMKTKEMVSNAKAQQPQWLEEHGMASTLRMTMASSSELTKALHVTPIPKHPFLKKKKKSHIVPTNGTKKDQDLIGSDLVMRDSEEEVDHGHSENDDHIKPFNFNLVQIQQEDKKELEKIIQEESEEIPIVTVKSLVRARAKLVVLEGERLNAAMLKMNQQREQGQGSSLASESLQDFSGSWRQSSLSSKDYEQIDFQKQLLIKKIKDRKQKNGDEDYNILTEHDMDELVFLEKKLKAKLLRQQEKAQEEHKHADTTTTEHKTNGRKSISSSHSTAKTNDSGNKNRPLSSSRSSKGSNQQDGNNQSSSSSLTPPNVLLFQTELISKFCHQKQLSKKKKKLLLQEQLKLNRESSMEGGPEVDVAVRVLVWRLFSSILPESIVNEISNSDVIGAYAFFVGSAQSLKFSSLQRSIPVSASNSCPADGVHLDTQGFEESLRKLRRVLSPELISLRRRAVELGRDIYSAICEDAGLDLWSSFDGGSKVGEDQQNKDVHAMKEETEMLNNTVNSEATTVQAGYRSQRAQSSFSTSSSVERGEGLGRSTSSHKSSSAEGTATVDTNEEEEDVYGEDFMAQSGGSPNNVKIFEDFDKPMSYEPYEPKVHDTIQASPERKGNEDVYHTTRRSCSVAAKEWVRSLKKPNQIQTSHRQGIHTERRHVNHEDDAKTIYFHDFLRGICRLFSEQGMDSTEVSTLLGFGVSQDGPNDATLQLYSVNQVLACLEVTRDWNGLLGALEKEASWCSIILNQVDDYMSKRRWRAKEFFHHLHQLASHEKHLTAYHRSYIPPALSPMEFELAILRMGIRGFSIGDLQEGGDVNSARSYPINVFTQKGLIRNSQNRNLHHVYDDDLECEVSMDHYNIDQRCDDYEKLVIWLPLFVVHVKQQPHNIESIVNQDPLDIGELWLRRYVLLPYINKTAAAGTSEEGERKTDFITISSLTLQHSLHKKMKKNGGKKGTSNQEQKVSLNDFENTIRNLKKYLPINYSSITPHTATFKQTRRSKNDLREVTFQESSCVLPWLSGANMLIQLSHRNVVEPLDADNAPCASQMKNMHLKLTNFEISCGCEIKYDEVGVGVSYRVVESLVSLWQRQSDKTQSDHRSDDSDQISLHQNGWFPFLFEEDLEVKLSTILALRDEDDLYDTKEGKLEERWLVAARDVALFVYLCVRAQIFDVQEIISCAFVAAPQVSLLCDEVGTLEYEMGRRNWHILDVFKKYHQIISPSFLTSKDPALSTVDVVRLPMPPSIFDLNVKSSNIIRNVPPSNQIKQNSDKNARCSSFFAKSSIDENSKLKLNHFQKLNHQKSKTKKKNKIFNPNSMIDDCFLTIHELEKVLEHIGCQRLRQRSDDGGNDFTTWSADITASQQRSTSDSFTNTATNPENNPNTIALDGGHHNDAKSAFQTLRGTDFDQTTKLHRSYEFDLSPQQEEVERIPLSVFTNTNETNDFESTLSAEAEDDVEDGVLMSKLADALSSHIRNLYDL